MTLICYLTRVAENILTTRIEFQQKFLSMLSCQKAVVLIFFVQHTLQKTGGLNWARVEEAWFALIPPPSISLPK